MGKFVLRDGERELARVHAVDTREQTVGALVLTQDRVVLLAVEARAMGIFGVLFGAIGGLMSAMAAGEKVTTQIPRTELATVELSSPGTLKLSTAGTGYGRIWFEVRIEDAERWQDTIRHWAEHGTVPGDYAKLPVAKIVKRG